ASSRTSARGPPCSPRCAGASWPTTTRRSRWRGPPGSPSREWSRRGRPRRRRRRAAAARYPRLGPVGGRLAGAAAGRPQAVRAPFAAGGLCLSAISGWEVALVVQRGGLVLRSPGREWIARSEALAGLRFLPVDTGIAIRSVELSDLPPGPADRLIVASAERLGATLVTKDERFRAGPGVTTLLG